MINKIDSISHRKSLHYNKKDKNKKENNKPSVKKQAFIAMGLVALGAYAYMQIKRGKNQLNNNINPFQNSPLALEDKSSKIYNLKDRVCPRFKIRYNGQNGQIIDNATVISSALDNKSGNSNALITTLSKQKMFKNTNGETIQNVDLTKGMAFLENGEPFSGLFKTTAKNGDVVEIFYKNGSMAKSYKNGRLFKEYELLRVPRSSFDDVYDDVYVEVINRYDKSGKNIIRQTFLNRGTHQFAKPKRMIVKDYMNDTSFSKDFFENGKISAESTYESFGACVLEKQKCFNQNGDVVSILDKIEDSIYQKTDLNTRKTTLYRADSTYVPASRETSIVEMKRVFSGAKNFMDRFKSFFQ